MSAARTERLLNLLTLLLNAKKPLSLQTIRELEEFSAYRTSDPKSGERAFERDKAALLELGIPLRWLKRDNDEEDEEGYIIDREHYYLPQIPLSPTDLALLSIAGSAALALPSFPSRAALLRALAKLGFDGETTESLRALAHVPTLPGVNAVQVAHYLDIIHDAIAQHLTVILTYQNQQREVQPYGLYYKRGIWYLVGFCQMRQAERTFHLGRVQHITCTTNSFIFPQHFNINAYASRRPWEFPQEPPIEVKIRLAKRLHAAVPEIFGSRVETQVEEDAVLVRLQVASPQALITAVLPYGTAAEIVEPLYLRQQIQTLYLQLAKTYA